jgi:membrane protein
MTLRDSVGLLRVAGSSWVEDRAARLGAALAYYTTFSLAPLLLLVVAVVGFFFGEQAAQGHLTHQLRDLVGEQAAGIVETMIAKTRTPQANTWATVVGSVMLIVGATGLFGQLQDALNTVWGVRPRPGRGIAGIVRDRFLSFALVLGCALLLLASFVASAALSTLGQWAGVGHAGILGQAVHQIVSFAVITLLFAMIYRFLPDAVIAWRDVWLGAVVTSLLFCVGKYLIGLYLGRSAPGSVYGAAGSLAVLLIWLYYSAQIFLFGAELTKAYANRYGSHIVPAANAEAVTEESRRRQGIVRTPAVPGQGSPRGVPDRMRG